MARESTLGPSIPVFIVSLVLGDVDEMQAVEVTFSYLSYKVPKFHANSCILSSTTVRLALPTLTPGAKLKLSMQDHRDTRRY